MSNDTSSDSVSMNCGLLTGDAWIYSVFVFMCDGPNFRLFLRIHGIDLKLNELAIAYKRWKGDFEMVHLRWWFGASWNVHLLFTFA